jgi:cell division protein FtsB
MGNDLQKRFKLSNVGLVILAVVGVFILGDLTRRMADARRLERDSRILGTQVKDLEDEQTDLQTQVAYATSEVMVEQWARGEAKMVGRGEKLVVPMSADGPIATATPIPSPSQGLPSKLDVWWALLFGE